MSSSQVLPVTLVDGVVMQAKTELMASTLDIPPACCSALVVRQIWQQRLRADLR